MSVKNLIFAAAGQVGGDYQIERSLRFNSADSAYLSRTPASASNQKTWTWSGWVKLSAFSADKDLFSADSTGGARFTGIRYTNANALDFVFDDATSQRIRSAAIYFDPSAWYHIVAVMDTTQATASNRMKLYVNGVQITTFAVESYPSQNADSDVNSTRAHNLGRRAEDSASYLNGYMADINFIDGQALTPSSFGEVDSVTGVWKPIAYAGTYGTNGFHLDFSDNSSTTALGYDAAGSNDWTPNNFSVTAGAGNDSLVDVPTRNTEDVDTGAGGEVRGNYCTVNPLLKGASLTIANGNLDINSTGANWTTSYGTIAIPTSGKWYWEVTAGGTNTNPGIALSTSNLAGNLQTYPADTIVSYSYYGSNGNKYTGPGNTSSAYGATFTTNDVIGVALDMDAGTLTFYKNGVSQGTAFSGLTGIYVPCFGAFDAGVQSNNFGQRPFAYTAPSGFKALVTTNLPDPTVVQGDDYFNTLIWTGTGSGTTRAFTGVGFQPDFVWTKPRNSPTSHSLYDSVRGAGNDKELTSNANVAEGAGNQEQYGYLSSFDSDGFTSTAGTLGAASNVYFNGNNTTYVAWNWKANGAGVSNTDGTISSTVSANTTAGISIVSWTATSGSQTVGHGLGVAPSIVIMKNRSTTSNWAVFNTLTSSHGLLYLNLTNASVTPAESAPTSTVFNVAQSSSTTGTTGNNMVAYCFAPISGFSAFGSYTGNGSTDGPFVYTGFRPAFVMTKRTDSIGFWPMRDNDRPGYNATDKLVAANSSDAEATARATDFLSNGFKLRATDSDVNASGGTYIYMAFAENPFKYALAR